LVPSSNVSNLSKAWYLQVLPLNDASLNPLTSTFDIFSAVVIPLIVISDPVATNFPDTVGEVNPKSVASTQNVAPPLEATGVAATGELTVGLVLVAADHPELYTVMTFFSSILLS
jgi:hypothetical protein